MKILRLILGDQLNHHHSWFDEVEPAVTYVFMEVRQETGYVKHHIQKVCGFFAAMRNFAGYLVDQGHAVKYLKINDPDNLHSIPENIEKIISQNGIERFEYQLPDEFRLDAQLKDFVRTLSIDYQACDTEHFLTSRDFLSSFFKGKKTFLMESFYRYMRKQHDILMAGDQPIGGQWNYDADNRNKWDGKVPVPSDCFFQNDVSDILEEIKSAGVTCFGHIQDNQIFWPVSRRQAEDALQSFCKNRLMYFGHYQDALSSKEPFLFHARISFALNTKMLHPMEVINYSIEAWQENPDSISLSQVEGFVRQVLGWREYMRGIYWAKMPEYAQLNFFDHHRRLPGYFWTGDTRMNCIRHAVNNSLDHAYAHHIQRLMVTGNFMLLAGIDPEEVDEWYLGIYMDAIEWVEITNTRGMSQFADGGIVGTKPYVSSANYIKKMGDYCNDCHYSPSKKHGEQACPFNSLYWHFYQRHRPLLEKNPRIGMMYRTWDKMKADTKEGLLNQAEDYLDRLEQL
jgi:deoxyribodipyrimidine photolyase-related protein